MKLPKLLTNKQRCLLGIAESGDFIAYDKLNAGLATWQQQYQQAKPFPHICLDNIFSAELLQHVEADFPDADHQQNWDTYRKENEWLKNATGRDFQIPFLTRHFLYALNSRSFLVWLEKLSGIKSLIPDTEFIGGGLHATLPGGKLGIHADFNKHQRNGLDRRLNLLIYLNSNWQENWGGALELWDKKLTGCKQKIFPIFNRMVIFSTTDYSFHGHPNPLQSPDNILRKSIALYYYTNGRPKEEVSKSHLTNYQKV